MIGKAYKRLYSGVNALIEHLATCILILFFIIVLLQVFFRYVLNAPLPWTEEAARYLNIWAVLLGMAFAVYLKDHLRVDLIDFVLEKLSVRAQAAFNAVTTFLPLLLVIVFLKGGFAMTVDRWAVQLPLIPLPQGVIYLGLVVSSSLMLWFLIHQFVEHIILFIKSGGKSGKLEKSGEGNVGLYVKGEERTAE
ncbi:TRAP transporter small permease [Bacillus sp. FJAT-45350]|uniref:TRAP transporter small permease n=1 Tax=Bacillus sp. FJAT-45350 TaxID=2011014 RepID=UPI000BB6DFD3|nr:TRAP transporter small permease [Bacillus sp. FJAT-45350]